MIGGGGGGGGPGPGPPPPPAPPPPWGAPAAPGDTPYMPDTPADSEDPVPV
jgi:hypothetical protein